MQTRIILMALAISLSPILSACATTNPSNTANGLNATGWSLSSLQGQTLLPDTQVTIHFEHGRVHGTDGCNRYSASYTAVDARLKVGENMVSTKMACPESVMGQAAAFLRVLSQASGYQRDARKLALLDADGKETAVFNAQSSELGEGLMHRTRPLQKL
jgi:heat shock protein HslJ